MGGEGSGKGMRLRQDKEVEVWELYVKGWNQTAIAKKLRIAQKSVNNWINEEIKERAKIRSDLAGGYLEVELARLDTLLELCFRDVATTVETQIVWEKDDRTGARIYSQQQFITERVDPTLVKRILEIMDERADYLGLRAPKQIEIREKTLEEVILASMQPPKQLEEGRVNGETLDVEAEEKE